MEGKCGLGGLASFENRVGREYTWGLRVGRGRARERKKDHASVDLNPYCTIYVSSVAWKSFRLTL